MFQTPYQAFRTFWSVFWRRLFRGPRAPSWSWLYEFVVEFARNGTLLFGPKSLQAEREEFEGLSGMAQTKGLKLEECMIHGCKGLWVEAEDGATEAGVVLYLHGGCYVMGSARSHLVILCELSRATGRKVLGLDYRLAPEHPCPAAIEDVLQTYQWLQEQGIAASQIAIGGDSAGAGLTLASLELARRRGLEMPQAAILFSPWVDLTLQTRSALEGGQLDHVFLPHLQKWAQTYAQDLPTDDPRVSPLFGDLKGSPPLCIVTGGAELMHDEAIQLHDRARDAGVETLLLLEEDEIHDFVFFVSFNPRARRAYHHIRDFLKNSSQAKNSH